MEDEIKTKNRCTAWVGVCLVQLSGLRLILIAQQLSPYSTLLSLILLRGQLSPPSHIYFPLNAFRNCLSDFHFMTASNKNAIVDIAFRFFAFHLHRVRCGNSSQFSTILFA